MTQPAPATDHALAKDASEGSGGESTGTVVVAGLADLGIAIAKFVGGLISHSSAVLPSDTTETYAYPAAGQPRPHAVQSVTQTTGSATTTDSYGWDEAGHTTARPGQALSYDARGKLGAVTLTADGRKQTAIYDAEGSLLVQSDPVNGTTAFLGDTQLRVAAGSSTVTASRTYTANGQSVAERNTTAGVAGSTFYFLDPDPLGTATAEVRATDGTITRRYQDPFGVPRGPAVTLVQCARLPERADVVLQWTDPAWGAGLRPDAGPLPDGGPAAGRLRSRFSLGVLVREQQPGDESRPVGPVCNRTRRRKVLFPPQHVPQEER